MVTVEYEESVDLDKAENDLKKKLIKLNLLRVLKNLNFQEILWMPFQS